MLDVFNTTIGGKPATIAKLPAHLAFDVACVVAEWEGRKMAAGAATSAAVLAAALAGQSVTDADGHATPALGPAAMEGLGRGLTERAKMLRDPEYRSLVWRPVLSTCMLANQPIFEADGQTIRGVHDLADLYELHEVAITHSCGSFLRALGVQRAEAKAKA